MKDELKCPKKSPYKVQVLDRAVHMMDFLSQQNGREISLPELSAALNLHKTTTHRIAQVLETHGLLRKDDATNRYRLGLHLYDLGCSALEHMKIREAVRPIMTRVALECKETVQFAVIDHAEILYIERIEARRSYITSSPPGFRGPIHCTGLGKALLAWLPEPEVDQVLAAHPMKPYTRKTITNVLSLKRELCKIRVRGYSIDNEEIEEGLRCIGVPVLDSVGRPVAAMSVAGPSFRLRPERYEDIGKMLRTAANELSVKLGYRTFITPVETPSVGVSMRSR